jgi:hypothetical protein
VAAGPSDGTPAPVNPFNGMQEREEVFAFAEKPKVAKTGEKWTITFASKGKCDATVTILGPDGKVVRRLASGVLGKNAPYPFQQNSLSQKIEWDGLTDMFQKAPAGCKVKVSLGIQAKFERNLIHDHYDMAVLAKQDYRNDVRLAVAEGPDGSRYLASINGGSVVGKVYDKDGKYLRTFMPPPAAELEKVDDGTGRKIVATKWGDKVIVPFWFGPWAYDNKWLEGDTADYPRVLAKLAGQDGFKLLGKAKSSGDAKQVQEESRPGWLPPAKSTFPFCTSKYVHAAVNPASEEVFLSDPFGISRFDGKTGESFQMPNLPGPFEHAVGPDGLLYALVVRGAYMWRVDREGKEVPFKDGVPIPRNESGPSKGWIIGTWWRPNPPDLAMTVILTGGNHSTNGCMKNGFSVSPAGIAMGMVEFPPAFLAEHKLKGNTPYVSVYSPDGKRLTVDAVGPMAGHGVTIDRDGNLYVAYTGLPDGQKVLDGMDPSSAGSGHPGRVGAGSLVKYRGLGGKFPLNVGPGQKFTGGKELPGSLWAYGGIVGQTGAGCGCGHVRVVIDGWARNWIPANHLCSVTVIDSNGNRIARLGRYGNVDDTEADLKAGKDGLRFCWPRAVVASDTALYVADVGNRRVLKAVLTYAAECLGSGFKWNFQGLICGGLRPSRCW